eukprot:CAMPEP_0197244232 /NCGR_PEP_ID=MMETSP1429-20130617/9428_1 /TAXON_ID=49237 /ORGANISM="Chaetoceros  sp., Strain UNC1202" /LENGTH=195 /DNA_ID=CAMNT_0042704571 /DNA_START=138 /DNA_END=725 /DNA_ORIENTATION=+
MVPEEHFTARSNEQNDEQGTEPFQEVRRHSSNPRNTRSSSNPKLEETSLAPQQLGEEPPNTAVMEQTLRQRVRARRHHNRRNLDEGYGATSHLEEEHLAPEQQKSTSPASSDNHSSEQTMRQRARTMRQQRMRVLRQNADDFEPAMVGRKPPSPDSEARASNSPSPETCSKSTVPSSRDRMMSRRERLVRRNRKY